MFLSFIIDTFGELRNTNAENTNDKDNICFICQISRDKCLMKNIDFDNNSSIPKGVISPNLL